jgi:hypothetical protein
MVENEQKPTPFDDPSDIEVYVNKIVGVSFDGATVGVTLGCIRVVPERLDTPPSKPAVAYVLGAICPDGLIIASWQQPGELPYILS